MVNTHKGLVRACRLTRKRAAGACAPDFDEVGWRHLRQRLFGPSKSTRRSIELARAPPRAFLLFHGTDSGFCRTLTGS